MFQLLEENVVEIEEARVFCRPAALSGGLEEGKVSGTSPPARPGPPPGHLDGGAVKSPKYQEFLDPLSLIIRHPEKQSQRIPAHRMILPLGVSRV